MIGKTLGQYEIAGLLGKGGMGEVYKARDTNLGRDVALKILPASIADDPERVARFQREARTIAALKHPNLVTLYSAEEADGVQFLTMELIEGGTLADAIPQDGFELTRFFELAIPLAQALNSAHEKGITHRDLKPTNIMLDEEGRPQILDFGLAQMIEDVVDDAATVVVSEDHTAEGTVMGTAGYMSPEQAEGHGADARSDIFSLGVVLYECITGRRPFKGDTRAQIISSVLRDTPPPVTEVRDILPRHLSRILKRCLEKDPKDRYQTARDLHNDLRGLRDEVTAEQLTSKTSAALPKASSSLGRNVTIGLLVVVLAVVGLWFSTRSTDELPQVTNSSPTTDSGVVRIVVVPMENLGNAEDEFFADGMTEEITSRLAVVDGLGVISRKSAMTYAGSDKTIQEIGAELNVEYALEGTVRWAKGADETRVRITQQLIRVSDDTHLWAQSYDRTIDDVFAIQSDIARQVIEELGIALLEPDQAQLESVPTSNPEAHELYLRAVASASSYDLPLMQRSVNMLGSAIELDPEFMTAHAELAKRLSLLVHFGWDATPERIESARRAAERAIELAPDRVEGHVAQGFYFYHGLKQYENALDAFTRASAIEPNDIEMLRGRGLVLRRRARWNESTDCFERAMALNPRDISLILDLLDSYISGSQWEKAERLGQEAKRLRPDLDSVYSYLAYLALARDGDVPRVHALLDQAPNQKNEWTLHQRIFAHAYEGNYQSAIAAAESYEDSVWVIGAGSRTLNLWRGLLLQLDGDAAGAVTSLRAAIEELHGLIETRPDGFRFHPTLALAYAALGQEEDARQMVQVALESFPFSRDTTWGPAHQRDIALVYTLLGDYERALEHVETGLSWPCYWTATRLRLDPWFRGLTEQPGFDEMNARAEAMRDAMFH